MIIANGTADVSTYFVLRDSTNHAPKTDVTVTDIDLYYVEHGAAISTKADATALASAGAAHTDNAAFHVGQGLYRIDWPDAAFDAGVGKVVTLIVVCTGVDATFLEVELSPAVNTVAVSGTAQTGRDLGASVLLSSGTGTGQISLTSGAVSVGSIAAGAITAAAIATDAIDADALAADAIAEINATVDTALADIHLDHLLATDYDPASKPGTATALLNELVESDAGVSRFTANALEQAPSGTGASAASIADAVWDELRADHVIAGSFGDIDTTADVADAVWDEARSGHTTAGTFGEGAASVQGNVTGSVGSVATGGITAASIATGAIDADALAADAVAEIWAGSTAPAASAIADAVWDEALSGHSTAGSAGLALSTASSGGVDPSVLADAIWDEALSGHATAGTAGKALSDVLVDTAEIGTAGAGLTALATAANLSTVAGYIDTEVAAIKAKTDNLPAAPAATGDIPTAATVADAVWDEARSGHVTAGSFGAGVASVEALGTQAKADVNAEMLDVLVTDTHAEPASVPAATSSLRDKIAWLFTLGRNKVTQTATAQTLRNDADSANIATATVSDDATTFTKGEWS